MEDNKRIESYKLAKIIDDYTVVVNKGSKDSVKTSQRFLVYEIGEEIYDPDTKASLGRLEIVKGTGRVTHVQENMATIESDMSSMASKSVKRIKRPGAFAMIAGTEEVEELLPAQREPFINPKVGDVAKPI